MPPRNASAESGSGALPLAAIRGSVQLRGALGASPLSTPSAWHHHGKRRGTACGTDSAHMSPPDMAKGSLRQCAPYFSGRIDDPSRGFNHTVNGHDGQRLLTTFARPEKVSGQQWIECLYCGHGRNAGGGAGLLVPGMWHGEPRML